MRSVKGERVVGVKEVCGKWKMEAVSKRESDG